MADLEQCFMYPLLSLNSYSTFIVEQDQKRKISGTSNPHIQLMAGWNPLSTKRGSNRV